MALIKEISDDTGAVFSYWRIGEIRMIPNELRVILTLLGYVSRDARVSGLKPSGMAFGFDLRFSEGDLPALLSASTGIGAYRAMAAVFYGMIKSEVNAVWIAPPPPDPMPEGWVAPDRPARHPLAGALDG